jgi:hypothetical protein
MDNPGARVIPTPHSFPNGLADALRWTHSRSRSVATAMDVFASHWGRQAGAVAALAPMANDVRTVSMLRLGLPELGPRAAQYALHIFVIAESEGLDTRVPIASIARAVNVFHETDADGYLDLDAFHDGTGATYRLLEARNVDPHLVVEEALNLLTGEPTIMLIAMAVSLAGAQGEALLREVLHRVPALGQNPDISALADAVEEGGYDFSW